MLIVIAPSITNNLCPTIALLPSTLLPLLMNSQPPLPSSHLHHSLYIHSTYLLFPPLHPNIHPLYIPIINNTLPHYIWFHLHSYQCPPQSIYINNNNINLPPRSEKCNSIIIYIVIYIRCMFCIPCDPLDILPIVYDPLYFPPPTPFRQPWLP